MGGQLAAGPVEQLLRQATRGQQACSSGRAMVCLHVMDDRGLIRVRMTQREATVELCATEEKVDLEQARLMRLLRTYLE